MLSISLSNLFVLPILALVSTPLIISACITIFFSVLTLSVRVFVIYVELFYAIITNFFAFPATSNSSLLNFSASGATTPTRSRSKGHKQSSSSDHFLHTPEGFYRLHSPVRSRNHHKTEQRNNSIPSESNHVRDYHLEISTNTRLQSSHKSAAPSPEGFLGLTTGDENRDFEGLGGWRALPPAHRRRRGSRSTSSSSSHSASDDLDERAWLSINNRLELPSRPLSMGSAMTDPAMGSPTESYKPKLHHRRSATTSSVTFNHNAGNNSSLAPWGRPARASALRPHSSTLSLAPEGWHPSISRVPQALPEPLIMTRAPQNRARFAVSPEFHSGDGYFALRKPRSNSRASSTSGNTTPAGVDERTSMNIGLSISHYPNSVRGRRRSSMGASSVLRTRYPPAWLGGLQGLPGDFSSS